MRYLFFLEGYMLIDEKTETAYLASLPIKKGS